MKSRTKAGGYTVRQFMTEGIAVLDHPRYGRQVWVRCQTRKPCVCAVTGQPIPAKGFAYRPLTNQNNRRERIAEPAIKEGFSCQ